MDDLRLPRIETLDVDDLNSFGTAASLTSAWCLIFRPI
jgi:hypothetical protein